MCRQPPPFPRLDERNEQVGGLLRKCRILDVSAAFHQTNVGRQSGPQFSDECAVRLRIVEALPGDSVAVESSGGNEEDRVTRRVAQSPCDLPSNRGHFLAVQTHIGDLWTVPD